MQAAANEIRLSANLRAEGLKERIAWQSERIEMAAGRKISRGTGILATIGATAPFVSLFGTVWGIMDSFIGISKAHTTNLAVVAPGIAEALLATALGLVAAIPAVMIYNVLARSTAPLPRADWRRFCTGHEAHEPRSRSREIAAAARGRVRAELGKWPELGEHSFSCSSWEWRLPAPKVQGHLIQSLCRHFRTQFTEDPARELFARKTSPLPGPPQSIGSYADGCLAGAIALPVTGSSWQVMRVSRNRYWGHPSLVAFIERLVGREESWWNGLLIGDMSQARGGPMFIGHSSHQIGLDVDIWFNPMPDHELSPEELEFNMALNMVAKDRPVVDPKVWTYERTALVRAAAQDPVVTRIFVNPAIKKAMCREAWSDRSWLSKVRPWWGHDQHFHVRIVCPSDRPQCKPQPPAGSGDGCGHELDPWLIEFVSASSGDGREAKTQPHPRGNAQRVPRCG